MITKKSLIAHSLSILLLIGADQLSKTLFISYLKTQSSYLKEVFPFFDIVYAWNYGISFGLFQQHYQYSNFIFLALNSLIIFYLFNLFYKVSEGLGRIGMTLIIGGALGNLFDRVFRGAVFDFLYFHYQNFSFPAFNLADSFISIGACFFLYSYIMESKHQKEASSEK